MAKERTISSPNWSPRPHGLADVFGVVLHHTATAGGSAEAVARMFADRRSQVSAHAVVDKDGSIIHCVPIERAAWHAGKCRRYDWDRDGKLEDWEQYANTHTLGIELVNRGDGRDPFPDAQLRAVARLIRRWQRRCQNLSLRSVTDHQAISLSGKIDLRPNFPAARLFWFLLHPRTEPPADVYRALPRWARRRVDEIRR